MLISTKGRYALRVLIDMAEHQGEGFVPLKEVAQRQGISEKYLESIVKVLVQGGVLSGLRGKGGGYRLCKDPTQLSLGSVLRLTEGSLSPVACLEEGAVPCERAEQCRTFPVWQELGQVINTYLDSRTLADLMEGSPAECSHANTP